MNIKRGNDESGAIFSECEKYRYVLWRRWDLLDPEPVYMAFIGLNPSTADETENDPTVRRCINFAKREGYQGLYMLNLFAYRATDPRVMKMRDDPIGKDNDDVIAAHVEDAGKTVACWGVDGAFQNRDKRVASLRRLISGAKTRTIGELFWALGTTKDGHPRHPLYLPSNAPLSRFTVKGYR